MIRTELESGLLPIRNRRMPFWTSSVRHFDGTTELGHSITRGFFKRLRSSDLPKNGMYIHFIDNVMTGYTEHTLSFVPAHAEHYLMDGTLTGTSHHLGKRIEHRDTEGRIVGFTEPLKKWGRVRHEGELSLAHLTGGLYLVRYGLVVPPAV